MNALRVALSSALLLACALISLPASGQLYAPTRATLPTPIPHVTSYAQAVLSDGPCYFWAMNTTSGTEPNLGSCGTAALTYTGSGTRGGAALVGDFGSASYTPGNTSGNYVSISSSIAGWPSTTTMTWEVWFTATTHDCGNGASVVNTWGNPNSNNGTFSIDVIADGTSCHLRGTSDNGNNGAACPDGTLTTGAVHQAVLEYNKSSGLSLYVDGSTTPCATQGSTYPAAWTGDNGPVMVGQFASRTVNNSPSNTFILAGQVADLSMYSTNLSTARIAAHFAAGNIVTPTPSPSPSPLGPPAGFTADQALCINNIIYPNILPTAPPGYGTASGRPIGEFELSGYNRALYDTYWGTGTTSQRIGTIGGSFTGVIAHLAALVTIPAFDGGVTITTDTASPGGISNGSTIEIGNSPGNTGNAYDSGNNDPIVLIGTLASGYGTTTWNITHVRAYYSTTPISTNTTIPLTSPTYGTATKIYGETGLATWNGGSLSFGKFDSSYNNYLAISGDGSGLTDPFTITTDGAVGGSPQGVRIAANPMPTPYTFPNDPSQINLDNFTMTTVTSSGVAYPAIGSTVALNVNSPTAGQDNWLVSIGGHGGTKTGIGVLVSGGCDNQNGCGSAGNPWTILILGYPNNGGSTPSGNIASSTNLDFWSYQNFFSGTIDKELDFQYGFLEASVRTPGYLPGNSAAFWDLQTQAGFSNLATNSLTRDETDIQEQFSSTSGTQVNSANLLWNYVNTGGSGSVLPYWAGLQNVSPDSSANYHQYATLFAPGGLPTPFPTPYASSPGDLFGSYPTTAGSSLYLDGTPSANHEGTLDITQGVAGKEVMATYQVGQPYNFLSPHVNVTTTTNSVTIPAVYGSSVTIGMSSTSGWVQMLGQVYDICTPSCSGSPTAYMHGLLVGVSGSNLTFYTMEGGGSAGYHDHGASTVSSNLPIGSQVTAVDGPLGESWPQYYWVQHIRAYVPNGQGC